MKSSADSAFIVDIKTSFTIKHMIVNTKRKRFKNNIRQYFFIINMVSSSKYFFFQFIGELISKKAPSIFIFIKYICIRNN